MVKAVVSDGAIRLQGLLPPEWTEGHALAIESWDIANRPDGCDQSDDMSPEEIEADFAEINALCAENDPLDDLRRDQAIEEHRHEMKDLARRELGL